LRFNKFSRANKRISLGQSGDEGGQVRFERNGFFVLVGDRQVTNLDDPVSLTGNPEISFVKLTPLVGG